MHMKKSDRGDKMNYKSKNIFKFIWGIIFLSGLYIIISGVTRFCAASEKPKIVNLGQSMINNGLSLSEEVMLPVVSYCMDSDENTDGVGDFIQMYGLIHPYSYTILNNETDIALCCDNVINIDDTSLVNAKNIVSTSVKNKFFQGDISDDINEDAGSVATQSIIENENSENIDIASTNFIADGIEYTQDALTYDFLINHFYTVDSTTSISEERLSAKKLLSMDMTMKNDNSSPQILIYHTHSQEAFADSNPSDPSTTIVGVGEYLAKLLSEKYGFNVLHDTTKYDFIDGKIDRNKAYSLASSKVSKILKENPNIEVVIDLHRDGIDGEKVVTNINQKPTAKIMFFNGLSYTNKNGNISYLENPYIEENLSFSLKLQIEAAKYYPGFTRKIYLKGYRYNLHLKPKALLIEAGAQNNTLEEEMNAMEPLADILAKVLNKQQ